jgi:hypothetical protein
MSGVGMDSHYRSGKAGITRPDIILAMQKAFPGYQPRTSRDLGKLWDNCTFTFDASALLDLYRMTRKTREEFLSILDRLKERVWLPHQTGLEYHDNRLEVIRTGLESHKRIAQWAHKAADGFTNYEQKCTSLVIAILPKSNGWIALHRGKA